ncbi:MAG: alpha/beta fold hydrolase [Thermoactinospora sp.]|nr:alpha/beta fold hydrolase [Thermoactinospora sp.]
MIFKTEAGRQQIHQAYRKLMEHWPVPYERIELPEASVVASGPAGAPPLILLHGSGGTSAGWASEVAALAEHHRVYAVDLPGEPGLSPEERHDLGSDGHARWLDGVLDGLGLTSASLVGESLGGFVALDYALRRPAKVEHLVLLNPGGLGRMRPSFALKALALAPLGRWGLKRSLRVALGSVDQAAADFILLIFTHFRPRRDPLPSLPLTDRPMLVVLGGRDAMIDAERTRKIVEELAPSATVRWLPESGHLLRGQSEAILTWMAAGGQVR